jgi:hypothetical protein
VTQSVSFHFTSPQFAFNSGYIAFFKGARLRSDGEISTGEITGGVIDGVLVEGPIEFDAMLYQLTVTRKSDNRPYNVTSLWVSRAMTADAIHSGCVAVELNLPVVLVIQVKDSTGATVPAVVSLSIPSMTATLEAPIDGDLVLFGTPGRHEIHLASVGDRRVMRERVSEEFDVKPDDTGERVIVLRVPPIPST